MKGSDTLTRRDFLRVSAAGAAALSLVGCGEGSGHKSSSAVTQSPVFRVDNIPDLPGTLPPPPDFHHPGLTILLRIMDEQGHPFYRTTSMARLGGPNGIIRRDDVVVIKPNQVALQYACTSTDLLRGLIQQIIEHPDGFTGEVVLIDQYILSAFPNSVNPQYTPARIVSEFRDLGYRVSLYMLANIFQDVAHEGAPHQDGFVDLEAEHPGDPDYECLTYPRFTTQYGTRIDLKAGVYNGESYDDRIRFINVPVMKNHHWMGMTCACKNLFGTTETMTWRFPRPERWLRNHRSIWETGFFGRLMKRVRTPDISIVDAMHVIHQPPLGPAICAPGGWVEQKSLLAGFDPVVLDYYAAKHVLHPIDTKAPCAGVRNNNNCSEPAPCLGNGGHCERADPDCRLTDTIDQTFWNAPMELWLEGGAPVNSLHQYLTTTSLALYGETRLGDHYVDIVRVSAT